MAQPQAQLNQAITNLSFATDKNPEVQFSQLQGARLVLYFYPKDNTPGCTQESKDFRDIYPQLQALNTVVLGVSRDNLKSHSNFVCKYELPFELVSDPDETLCQYFNVLKEKSLFLNKYLGIERSTFLIDEQGILRKEWRKVKVPGHAQEVLQAINAMISKR